MKRWLRRLRGIVGIGTLWGVAGTAFGTIGGLIAISFGGPFLLDSLVGFALGAGGLGFVLGAGFAGALTMIEGRRTLEELSPRRAAFWGGLAGALVSLVVGLVFLGPTLGTVLPLQPFLFTLLAGSGFYGALSSALAYGTVALAKRAPLEFPPGLGPDGRELLGAPSDS